MVVILFVVARLVTVPVINRVHVLLMLIHVHVILKILVHIFVVVMVVIRVFVEIIFVIAVLIVILILLPLVMEQTVLRIVSNIQIIIVK